MKTLILLRHAKARAVDPAGGDFERPLDRRGHDAARAIGRELRALGLGFDAVLASPAARVVETLADVSDGYGGLVGPVYDRRLYLASAESLLARVRETDDSADRLLVAGHNPGLEALALLLTRGDEEGLRGLLEAQYPTAAVAEIALPVEHWRDVAAGTGRLDRFIRPSDLEPLPVERQPF